EIPILPGHLDINAFEYNDYHQDRNKDHTPYEISSQTISAQLTTDFRARTRTGKGTQHEQPHALPGDPLRSPLSGARQGPGGRLPRAAADPQARLDRGPRRLLGAVGLPERLRRRPRRRPVLLHP